MKQSMHAVLLVLMAGLFVVGCATTDSITASQEEAVGAVSLQLENPATGETVVVRDVLPENATQEEREAAVATALDELGWANGDVAGNPAIQGRGVCGSTYNCGPLVWTSSGGWNCEWNDDPMCSCNVACGKMPMTKE